MSHFLVQGSVVSAANGQPVPYATVQVFQVNMPGYTTSLLTTTTTALNGTFSAPFTFASPPRPNVILRVSQTVAGTTTYIYQENPATDTRWSIADVVNVTLKASGTLVTSSPSTTGAPAGNEFVFTRVGNIVTGSISQTNGYAYPNEGSGPYMYTTADSDAPFGGTLWIGAWFGAGLIGLGAQYYQVQWAPGAQAANGPGPWSNVADPLTNSYFDFSTENWVSQAMGPTTVSGVPDLYQLPGNPGTTPWAFPDLIAQLDSTTLPTGTVVTLRAIGYTAGGGIVGDGTLATWLTYLDPFYGTLKLQIDNTPPSSVIITGINISGSKVGACQPANLGSSSSDYLEVDFEASDPAGHLRDYSVNAIWGANNYVMPPPSPPTPPPPPGWSPANDNYAAHIKGTNKWAGSASFATRYYGNQYNSVEMGACAYDFRLVVDKRTTDGYGLVYAGYEYDFTMFLTRS
jgi:hypothetical protein